MLFLYPEIRGQIEVMALVMLMGCLLSIWTVFGRSWWFFRVCVVCVAVLTLLPIRAYQPMVWFVFTGLVSVASLVPLRWWSERVSSPPVSSPSASSPSVSPSMPRSRWGVVLSGATGAGVAFYSLDRVIARTPAMGLREMAFVFLFVFFAVVMSLGFVSRRWPFERSRTLSLGDVARSHGVFKFSLSDALLATGVLAFAAAIAMYALRIKPIEDVGGFLLLAGLVVVTTWLVAAVAVVRHLPTQLLALVTLVAFVQLSERQLGFALRWCSEMFVYGTPRGNEAQVAMSVTARGFTLVLLTSVFMGVAAGWCRSRRIVAGSRGVVSRTAQLATVVLGLLVLTIILPVYAKMFPSLPPRPFSSTPDERTAYLKLVAEVERLQPLVVATKGPLPESTLQKFDSLSRKRFAVWGDEDFDTNLGARLAAFRTVGQSLQQRTQAAVTQRRYADAVEHALQGIRLGAGLARGGTFSHSLLGISTETSLGYQILAAMRDDIPYGKIPNVIAELASIEQSRESLASYQAAADLEGERSYGWRYRLNLVAFDLSSARPEYCHTMVSATIQATEDAIKRRDIMNRLLKTYLAIRWYESQFGEFPAQLQDLVPEFLASVPIDPFVNRPLVYRREGDGFVLYGVGIDGVDDGGKFGNVADLYGSGFDYDIDTTSR